MKTPILDKRTSVDIFKEALKLALVYCPEWAGNFPQDIDNYFSPDGEGPNDKGVVMLKLFSRLTKHLVTQINRLPDKHKIIFLDFVGIDLLPPKPASVPLTFNLSKGTTGTFVSKGTTVASEEDTEVVFETTEDLQVDDFKFKALFSINPWEDKYTNHSNVLEGNEEEFMLFGKDAAEKAIEHVIYLGDDILFYLKGTDEILEIKFEGNNLSHNYFAQWYDGNGNLLDTGLRDEDGALVVVVKNAKELKPTFINNVESIWLSIRPEGSTLITNDTFYSLPEISNITSTVNVIGILPEAVFFNNSLVDAKKGFYPFGEAPKYGDTLYIGANDCFSKVNAEISLEFQFEKELNDIDVTLSWEYWDGNRWNIIEDVKDNTNAFTKNGQITFVCPTIIPVEIEGALNKWARVKIVSGGYGSEGTYVETTPIKDVINEFPENDFTAENKNRIIEELNNKKICFGINYQPPSFTPPLINFFNMGHKYESKQPQWTIVYNDFLYKNINMEFNELWRPYGPSAETKPALFLGFEKNISNVPITLLFVSIYLKYGDEEKKIPCCRAKKSRGNDKDTIDFAWKYFDGSLWGEFDSSSETDVLVAGEIVKLLPPSDLQKTVKFERDLYWLKLEPYDCEWLPCPVLNGIFPNAVNAVNAVTIENEVLGSGTGDPVLSLSFLKTPVLEGQIIEVKEDAVPSIEEQAIIVDEEGKDAIRMTKDECGEINEIWTRWHQVSNFTLSSSLSRHYILDRTNGTVTFGDGTRGMSVPVGSNNIMAVKYLAGGGKRGNQGINTITGLRTTIPGIDNVLNQVSSFGGKDLEVTENVVNRGPHTVKNRGRAITKEDFEWLACEASQNIIEAKCFISGWAEIKIIIVPRSEENTPLPNIGLINNVRNYLEKRCLVTLRNSIKIVGPEYRIIDIEITAKPNSPDEYAIVIECVKRRFDTYLHPVNGSQDCTGWKLGQNIFISEVANIIEDIDGVDYVEDLVLKKIVSGKTIEEASNTTKGWINIEDHALPFGRNVNVTIT